VSKVAAFSCPNCGASITLQAAGWSVTVACATCGSVLDALDPNLRVLQEHALRVPITPKIPLGTRGRINGRSYDVIGCQSVTIVVDGIDYSWMEYVCFNPYHGFVYLSEYNGHWNVIEKLRRRTTEWAGGNSPVRLGDRTYRHFQSANARTSFALGEFPWELRVGDTVNVRDFTSPPYLLSAEGTDQEVTWSRGRYTTPKTMAAMFSLPSLDRAPEGVFANQPNPHLGAARRVGRTWRWLMLGWAAMLLATVLLTAKSEVLTSQQQFRRGVVEGNAVVLGPFDLTGRPSNVRVHLRSDVSNDWLWFGLALIDEATGQARDFSAQTSYYFGTDSDGNWSEGSQKDDVTLSAVPAGRYLLRVGPEGEPTGSPQVGYAVRVERDVPTYGFFWLAVFALLVPVGLAWWPVIGFENRRWLESDHEGVVLSFPPEEPGA
jgi:hypothetical protein